MTDIIIQSKIVPRSVLDESTSGTEPRKRVVVMNFDRDSDGEATRELCAFFGDPETEFLFYPSEESISNESKRRVAEGVLLDIENSLYVRNGDKKTSRNRFRLQERPYEDDTNENKSIVVCFGDDSEKLSKNRCFIRVRECVKESEDLELTRPDIVRRKLENMNDDASDSNPIVVTKNTINQAIYSHVSETSSEESVANEKSKIFVIGARGQIGKRIVKELVKEFLLTEAEIKNKTIEIVLSARGGTPELEGIIKEIEEFLPEQYRKNIKFVCVNSSSEEYIKQMSESDIIINAAGTQLNTEQEAKLGAVKVLGREGMIIANYAIAEQLGKDVAQCDELKPKPRLVLSVTNQTDAFNTITKIAYNRATGGGETKTTFTGVSGLVDNARLSMLLLFKGREVGNRSMIGSHDSNMFLSEMGDDKEIEEEVRVMGGKISANKSAGKKTHEGATILPSVSIANLVVKMVNGESVATSSCVFVDKEELAENYGIQVGSPASVLTVFDGRGEDKVRLENFRELNLDEQQKMKKSQVGVCRCAIIGMYAFYVAKLLKIRKENQILSERVERVVTTNEERETENTVIENMKNVATDLKELFGEDLFKESQKSLKEDMKDAITEVAAQLAIREEAVKERTNINDIKRSLSQCLEELSEESEESVLQMAV
ncbi:MAG: hypothetical protein LBG48_01270 [Rickettsiales bacterium]|jgi:hypothetical protein|nr:hypothetical protein [Rickettsiales bacterium]